LYKSINAYVLDRSYFTMMIMIFYSNNKKSTW